MSKIDKSPQTVRAQRNGISRQSQIWLDRLARDAPKLLEEVNAGRLSIHAAAIKAGFKRTPTALDRLKADWAKASKRERAAFRSVRQANHVRGPP